MTGPLARSLPDGRLHLNHGPIDLIIGAQGHEEAAFAAAQTAFDGMLESLVAELAQLRQAGPFAAEGPVARRMQRAIAPHAKGAFVTPMAAVAGAVADAVLQAMLPCAPRSAYVNNGGDIALHLTGDARFDVGVVGPDGRVLGQVRIASGDPARGIASSGQAGRSHSLGIAQSVTVLAQNAAQADVAATLIANAVDLPGHPNIRRIPACDLSPDSDLGARLVVTSVGALTPAECSAALDAGRDAAARMLDQGLIHAAALFLRGQSATVGTQDLIQIEGGAHA